MDQTLMKFCEPLLTYLFALPQQLMRVVIIMRLNPKRKKRINNPPIIFLSISIATDPSFIAMSWYIYSIRQ